MYDKLDKTFRILSRKKPLTDTGTTQLAKVLGTLDLTALGIGSTLGVGIYVLAGEVSKTTAGPAVVVSFLIAAIASVMAGLCYAEFGARVPKAGSAYIYGYVTIGEFIAFLIGWNLILEYSIGAASVVKGLSTYLDSLLGYPMRDFFTEHMPMDLDGLADFPDFFAFGATLVFALGLAFGARESTFVNSIFTLVNLTVVLYVVITGSFAADPANWFTPAENVPDPQYGDGGFAPYGIAGIIKGAAICFYGFIGFDVIATAGEETKNPKKSIPVAVIVSLLVIFLAYFSISTVLTMMLPYYEQDENAPLPYVFKRLEWTVAERIVSIGAIFGLCASLMGAMFPLPRVIYAMSIDGLIFEFMGRIHPKFKTPFFGTIIAGTLTGGLAAIFNLSQLVSMMSIGTLLAYSMVAACVLLLRFEVDDVKQEIGYSKTITEQNLLQKLWNSSNFKSPTKYTSGLVTWAVTLYCILCFFFALVITQLEEQLFSATWWTVLLLCISVILLIGTLIIIQRQPLSSRQLSFKVPFVPWLPGISILVNIYLMMTLDTMTWIRFAVWIAVGLAIYFGYGIWKSKQRFINVPTTTTSQLHELK